MHGITSHITQETLLSEKPSYKNLVKCSLNLSWPNLPSPSVRGLDIPYLLLHFGFTLLLKLYRNIFLHTKVPSASLIFKQSHILLIFLFENISYIANSFTHKIVLNKNSKCIFCAHSPIEIIKNYNSLGYNSFLHEEIKMGS